MPESTTIAPPTPSRDENQPGKTPAFTKPKWRRPLFWAFLLLFITFAALKTYLPFMSQPLEKPRTLKLEVYEMNPLGENTILVYDETLACLIVDPGCYTPEECDFLCAQIRQKGLKPLAVVNTHCHFDHVFGVRAMCNAFGIPWWIGEDEQYLLSGLAAHTALFGFTMEAPPPPARLLKDGDKLAIGNSSITAIQVPGHTRGSLCFYSEDSGFLIAGDVLFAGSIGRTDLPGGNFETLIRNISGKLLVLPPQVEVYPGHGPSTTIGNEALHNPFLNRD